MTLPTDAVFDGICFVDSLNGWIAGGSYLIDGGIVGRTRDGGRTWRFRSGLLPGGGTRSGLGSIVFRDTLHGCVVGSAGIVLLTDDGGENWRKVRDAGSSSAGLSDVFFVDRWNGWAVSPTRLLRTTDGGETWEPLTHESLESGYFSGNAIHFTNDHRGWLVGHGGVVKRTENGGHEWTSVSLPLPPGERPTLWDVEFTDDAHGWVVGERGVVFHTADYGATWTLQQNGVPVVRKIPRGEPRRPREPIRELETEPDRLTLFAVRFLDAQQGRAVGYYSDVGESVVIGTSDGGETWSVERVQPGECLRALFLLDADHAWAVGDRARTQPQVLLRYARPRR